MNRAERDPLSGPIVPVDSKSATASPPPDKSDTGDKGTPPDTSDKKGAGEGEKGEKIFGKYDNLEEAEKGFKSLESKLGEMGNEMSSLKTSGASMQQNLIAATQMIQNLQSANAKAQAAPDPAKSHQKELDSLLSKATEIDFDDVNAGDQVKGLLQGVLNITGRMVDDVRTTTEKATLEKATDLFQKTLRKKDEMAIRDNFLKDNPEFLEAQKTGALEKFKQSPLDDDYSAFLNMRIAGLNGEIEEKTKALEEAKKIADLAGGDAGTETILSKPGGDIKYPSRKTPMSKADALNHAVGVLQKVKAAQTGGV